MKIFAIRDNERGNQLLSQGLLAEAERYFQKAAHAASDWSAPWFNLGLVYKQQCRWAESLECNQRAAKLSPKDDAAWWNLGIAATALGKWRLARQAWRHFGVNEPLNDEELRLDLGLVPIRINPKSEGEVVWGLRIDPARALIKSVPLPSSEHHFGDLVLHDGAPNGHRILNGKEVPVFDALQRLHSSKYATFEVTAEVDSTQDVQALIELVTHAGLGAEDWGTIRMLCKQCSEGTPHEHTQPTYEPTSQVRIGLAAPSATEADELLEDWLIQRPSCQVIEMQCVLTP